jgi:hypothetical protein
MLLHPQGSGVTLDMIIVSSPSIDVMVVLFVIVKFLALVLGEGLLL